MICGVWEGRRTHDLRDIGGNGNKQLKISL